MARRIVRAYKTTNLAPLRGDYRGYVAVSVEQDDEEFHNYIYRKAAGPMAVLAIAEGGLVWGGGLEPRKPATSANIDAWIATQRGRHFWSGLIDSWDGCERGEEYLIRDNHGYRLGWKVGQQLIQVLVTGKIELAAVLNEMELKRK